MDVTNQIEIPNITADDIVSIRHHLEQSRLQLALKRFFDLVGASILILLLLPVLIGTVVAIKISSPGSVFFTQQRVGLGGQLFKFIKFRSMWANGKSLYPEAQTTNSSMTGELHKLLNDPRVTPVGFWLRKFSIDELPQLFNVLTGSMSLVGPRPLMPHMLAPYPSFASVRHLVRPGITGLWQIRDRSNCTNAHYMVEHDIEYLKTFSLWLDVKIILATIPAVVYGRGAF